MGEKSPILGMDSARVETTIFRNLVHSPAFVQKAYPHLKPDYFGDPADKAVFNHIARYIDKYSVPPTVEALVISLDGDTSLPESTYASAVEVVSDLKEYDHNTTHDWVMETAEKFCKDRALYNAISKSIRISDGSDKEFSPDAIPTLLADALAVCFDTDVGHDFFANAHDRYAYYHCELSRIPFDLADLNRITDGGLPKKTLTCLLAGCVHPDTLVTIRVDGDERHTQIIEIKHLIADHSIEILGADGFVPVVEFVTKGDYEEFVLETEDGTTVRVNMDHLFETDAGWVRAEDMVDGTFNVLTESDVYVPVKRVYKTGNIIPIVDIQIDHENHRYYANGISSHNTNVGKSLIMCHMAAAFLAAGKNVLYFTMEMSEIVTSSRIEANLLNVDVNRLKHLQQSEYTDKIASIQKRCGGRLIVKEYPTSGAHVGHFAAFIDELKLKKGFVPDVIFVDYLNICLSSRIKGNANANSYTVVKSIAEELRGLAVKLDLPIITATQTTRSATSTSDLSITDVSESIGLAATVDMLLGVIRTPELDEMNQLLFKLLKSRFVDAASHPPFTVGVDRGKMRLFDVVHQDSNYTGTPKHKQQGTPTTDEDQFGSIRPRSKTLGGVADSFNFG